MLQVSGLARPIRAADIRKFRNCSLHSAVWARPSPLGCTARARLGSPEARAGSLLQEL